MVGCAVSNIAYTDNVDMGGLILYVQIDFN